MNKRYQWNDVIESVATGRKMPVVDADEIRVTLACGATAYGWGEYDATQSAEMAWHENNNNQFVEYLGTPRHVEVVGLSRDDVLERVPTAKI